MRDALHREAVPLSPASVRQSIVRAIDRVIGSMEKIQSTVWGDITISFFLIALYLSFYPLITMNSDLMNNREAFFETRYFWTLPALVPIIVFVEILARHMQIRFEAVLLFCSLVVFSVVPEILTYASYSYVPSAVRMSLVFVLAFHLLIFKVTRELQYSVRLVIFMITEVGLVFFLNAMMPEASLTWSFWITHPYRYIFTFTMLAADEEMKRRTQSLDLRFFSFILSPTNWISPLPIRYKDWQISPDHSRLRAKGSVYLLISFCMLVFCAMIWNYRGFLLMESNWAPRWLNRSVLTYIFYFCFSYPNINIPVSLGWRFGFSLPEPYDVPLLSTSPQDRWRRWNFYFYDWYFRSVFFPVFRKTKSSFAGVMLSFYVTLFIHLGPQNAEFLMVPLTSGQFSRHFFKRALFFTAHGLAVYFGMKLEKWIPNENTRQGWWAVIGMFFLMSLIHWFVAM